MKKISYQIETHRNLSYQIVDGQYDDPIEYFDLLGTVNTFIHRNITIGHIHDYDTKSDLLLCLAIEYNESVEEIENDEERNERIDEIIEENYIILDIYIFNHGGYSISTAPYSCTWDSGHGGYVYASFDKIKKWFKVDEITYDIKQRAIELIKDEIRGLDRYIRGESYYEGIIKHNNDWFDSIGAYDTYEDAEKAAIEYIKNNSII